MIKPLNFSAQSNDALLQFSEQLMTILTSNSNTNSSLNSYIEALSVCNSNFQENLIQEKKRIRKAQIREKYGKPKTDVVENRTQGTLGDQPSWTDAVEILADVFSKHDFNKKYDNIKDETNALLNLISELNTKCAKELNLINSFKREDSNDLRTDLSRIEFKIPDDQKKTENE